jgi:hypothetical protein
MKINRMQELAGILKEYDDLDLGDDQPQDDGVSDKIKNIAQAQAILTELVNDYIADSIDSGGDELDWGNDVTGYETKSQLIKDFILYAEAIAEDED